MEKQKGKLANRMIILVDGTIHGDAYVTPIVIVCKLCKWLIILVDDDHHGDGYITPIAC